MASTPKYNIPLPNPMGLQQAEVRRIGEAFGLVEAVIAALADHLSDGNLEDRFASRTDPAIEGDATFAGMIDVLGDIKSQGSSVLTEARRGALNGVASLDAMGKLPEDQLPAIAITDTFVVANQAAMLALNVERGDIAVRSDLNKTFVLANEPATALANWVELRTPTDAVLSVAGKVGAVTLALADVVGLVAALTGKLSLSGGALTGLLEATPNSDNRILLPGRGIYQDLYLNYSGGGNVGFWNGSSWTFRVTSAGVLADVAIPSSLIQSNPTFTGTLTAVSIVTSGNISGYSDARLKFDVETIEDALEMTNQMRGVRFTMNGKRGIGVIAQEFQKIAPELVEAGDDEDETLSVAYGNTIGILIEAIKTLSAKVDRLERAA